MKYSRFLFHVLIVAVMAAAVLGFSGAADVSHAAADDMSDGVYFEEPYAEAGGTLTVKYDGDAEELSCKWFVDGEAVESETDESLAVTADHYETTVTAEVWSGASKLGEASMFCSKLPVLYIDTEGGADVVTKEYYLDAEMHLQGNEIYNTETTKLYTGATEIKGRGNSTWEYFPKKPYKLKLDKKTDLFGLGKNKHWVLLANYIDESNMRNMLAGDVAETMGVGAMDGTWVEVVLNGRNLGTYMLCEHVRLSEDRVNVFDWESAAEDLAEAIAEANGFSEDDMDALTDQMAEEDMSWISSGEVTFNGSTYKTVDYYDDLPDSFSGGYLLEMDYGYDEVSKFTTTNGAPIMFKSPEFINTDEVAMNTVIEYIQTFEDAIYSSDFNTQSGDRTVSYTEMCDMDSLVSFWFTSELFMNEIGTKSTYMQKDIDQLLVFGPVWDFDFSSGAVSPFSAQNPTDWTSDNRYDGSTKEKWWFLKMMRDPYFAVKVREAYLENEDYLKNIIADDGLLAEWHEYLKESGAYNDELWQYSRGFEADYEALDEWLTERISWMDRQFATNAAAMKSMDIAFSDKISMKLQGATVKETGSKAYASTAGNLSYDLQVAVDDDNYTEINYYINSKFQGTVALTDGQATIVIREDQLTEAVGDDNVITVWLRDSNGDLTAKQYITVKLTSGKELCNVVFNDMGGTHSDKVQAGDRVYLDQPVAQEADYVFEGWNDGVNTYPAGKWLDVNDDIFLNAVWTTCSNGEYEHELVADGETSSCIREGCTASKASGTVYADVSACILTVSNRFSNYYSGNQIRPVITLIYGDRTLVQGEDYTVTYKNNINAGYANYTVAAVEGSGFKGEYTLSYRILPQEISSAAVKIPAECEISSGAAEPAVTLTYNGRTLVQGTDYDLSYADNTAPGTGTVNITGKGNFTGSVSGTFKVIAARKNINNCTVTGPSGTLTYTGKAVKPAVTVKNGSTKLTAGTHYTVTYSNNIKCGTATVTVKGVEANGYKGTKQFTFKIRPAKTTAKVARVKYNQQKVTWSKVTGATKYYVYRSSDNKTFKLVKTVKSTDDRVYNSKSLTLGKTYYYKVKAVRAEKKSSGTVTYAGPESSVVKQKTYLTKGSIKSAANVSAKSVVIKWTGIAGAQGYKVYRSTSGKTGTYKVIKTVKVGKQYKDKKLVKGKRYYYKVRPYRVVNGKNVYGEASNYKSVKIKK